MPLDAVCLRAVVNELAPQLAGARIEKIQQPARDQVVLLLRGGARLLLCANPNQPRIHMTEKLRDNPSQPPMFCMLLRKRIGNGRIVSVEQAPLERVVTLHIEAADEMGEQSRFSLILEALGRHANLILCDKESRILDCLRRVDLEMSQERQVLPGLFYHLPPRQEKRDPLSVTQEEFTTLLPREEISLDSWLLDNFTAMPTAKRGSKAFAYSAQQQLFKMRAHDLQNVGVHGNRRRVVGAVANAKGNPNFIYELTEGIIGLAPFLLRLLAFKGFLLLCLPIRRHPLRFFPCFCGGHVLRRIPTHCF